MVKLIEDKIPDNVFAFLGIENSAILSSFISCFPGDYSDSRLSVQYEGERITSVFTNISDISLLFLSDSSNIKELEFGLSKDVYTPDFSDKRSSDTLFLMSSASCFDENSLSADISEIPLDMIIRDKKVIEQEKYLYAKGKCKASAVKADGVIASFGLISFCEDYAVITDVFTLPEYRDRGFASSVIRNLLSMVNNDKVFLLTKFKNINFYKKLGFSPCKAIGRYSVRE